MTDPLTITLMDAARSLNTKPPGCWCGEYNDGFEDGMTALLLVQDTALAELGYVRVAPGVAHQTLEILKGKSQ